MDENPGGLCYPVVAGHSPGRSGVHAVDERLDPLRHGGIGPSRAERPSRAFGGSRAREIVEERYVRGELSTDEYLDKLQVLGR